MVFRSIALLYTVYLLAFSAESYATAPRKALDLSKIRDTSMSYIYKNLSESGITPGAVVASPSRKDPNYFHHWTRDAGLVMDAVITFEQFANATTEVRTVNRANPAKLDSFANWFQFEEIARKAAKKTTAGLGEPVFEVDGSVFASAWGRPQNDGPAIRALSFMKAFEFEDQTLNQKTRLQLINAIHDDLLYVLKNFQRHGHDLWEETVGLHFFTGMMQLKAITAGEAWARSLQDHEFADQLKAAQPKMIAQLNRHYDSDKNRWRVTIDQSGGWSHKESGLDISVLLAYLYFQEHPDFPLNDKRLQNTIEQLEGRFRALYPITQQYANLGISIGRYPEDVYDGNGFSGGNPWFLATAAVGEYYCRLARRIQSTTQNTIQIADLNTKRSQQRDKNFRQRGLGFIERVAFHAGEDLNMSEQFNRYTGYRQGARTLSWSFAALYRAASACDENFAFNFSSH